MNLRFLISALDPHGKSTGTQYVGGWVGPGASLDIMQKIKTSFPHWEVNPDSKVMEPRA
jgi:hypothetical protein